MDEDHWKEEATFILRTQMRRRKFSFKKLSAKLEEFGIHETAVNLSNKIARGTFSFMFYLQCARAMGIAAPSVNETTPAADSTRPDRVS